MHACIHFYIPNIAVMQMHSQGMASYGQGITNDNIINSSPEELMNGLKPLRRPMYSLGCIPQSLVKHMHNNVRHLLQSQTNTTTLPSLQIAAELHVVMAITIAIQHMVKHDIVTTIPIKT